MMVIVPNALSEAINRKLDEAMKDAAPEAEKGRDELYRQLLVFFDEHGYIPEFTVGKREEGRP